MGPRGFGGFCLALLCSGVALGFQEEESGNGNVTEEVPEEGTREPLEPSGHPGTARGDGDTVTTWPRVTRSPPGSGDLVVTPVGNQTRIRDQVIGGSDSSDLGALVQSQDPIPKIPTLQRDRKDPEPSPGPEHTETSFGQPDQTRPAPDSTPNGS